MLNGKHNPGRSSRHFAAALLLMLAGCRSFHAPRGPSEPVLPSKTPVIADPVPRELSKSVLPEYVIEPPDVLLINAVKVVPLPPYRLSALDVVVLRSSSALPDAPLDGPFVIEPGGAINLGPPYGQVLVDGLTIDEATVRIHQHLEQYLASPEVNLALAETVDKQQISGEHIVGPDGKISLGTYGKVFVAGLTQAQTRAAIEAHLTAHLDRPEVAVDIYAYNSKVYYVVTQGAGLGDGVTRFPITGNETVLDAIAQINGMESVSSKRIWIARPAPHGTGCAQILQVDWRAITEYGRTATNYQLMPGDRLFIAEDRLVATDTFIAKLTAPVERLFGFTLLGTQTVSGLRFFKQGGQRGGGFGSFF